MNWTFSTIRYVLLFLLAGFISSVFQPQLINLYKYILPNEIGGGFDIDFTGVVVLFYSIEFLLPFLILTFGDRSRYWIAGITVALLGIFEFLADQFNFSGPLLLLISGLFLGWLVRLIATHTLGKMQALEPLKKYF